MDATQTQITAAYLDLAKTDADWVRLAMIRTGMVHLAPDSNRKVLTDADHAAALRIGSEDKHLLAIEDDYFQS